MTTDIAKRVARGVKWLDRHAPGWEERIKLREFDIADGCKCVLGQVFEDTHGEYMNALKDWSTRGVISQRHARACGFTVLRNESSELFPQLQSEWKRVIRERKGGKK